MPTSRPTCRTCARDDTAGLGPLPDVDVFAGTRLARPLPGGHLYACRHCGFVFRTPILADHDYHELYGQGRSDVWEQGIDREDFRLVTAEVGAEGTDAPRDVLDIGCYTGALLSMLPKDCRLHGVDPNPAAAAAAAARGVHIVARHWIELDAEGHRYDIIMACDVIEHIDNPLAFLSALCRKLKPAGTLLITTGNAQAWPWRLTRARFWYCYFPEHISFISPRWLHRMSPSAHLHVQRLQRFSHSPLPGPTSRALALAKTCFWLLAAPLRRTQEQAQPLLLGSGIAHDHLFCVLRRT